MSLIATAVRICTAQALLGCTLAGTAVDDSPIDPVAVATDSKTPYIAVFTDTENNKPDGRSMVEGDHVEDLSIHIFLPAELNLTIGGVAYDFQTRDSGSALVIDLIYRQIQRTLMEGESVWAQLWQRFVNKIISLDIHAYVLTTPGANPVRTPAREVMLRLDTLFDPPLGAVPSGVWEDFIAALNADPDLQGLGVLIGGMITGDLLPQWQQDAADLGLSAEEIAGLGLGAVAGAPDAIAISEVDVDRDDGEPLEVTSP